MGGGLEVSGHHYLIQGLHNTIIINSEEHIAVYKVQPLTVISFIINLFLKIKALNQVQCDIKN